MGEGGRVAMVWFGAAAIAPGFSPWANPEAQGRPGFLFVFSSFVFLRFFFVLFLCVLRLCVTLHDIEEQPPPTFDLAPRERP